MFATDLASIFSDALTQAFGPEAVVFAIAAIGLNIHFGYTGLLNFGQVGFMLMGAYGLGVGIAIWDQHWFISVIIGIIFSLALALILGFPTLRLRADYLAIVTIAAAEILRLIARSKPMRGITRGAEGLNEWAGPFQDMTPWQSTTYDFGPLTYTKMAAFAVVFGRAPRRPPRSVWSISLWRVRGVESLGQFVKTKTPPERSGKKPPTGTRCSRSWSVA